MSPERVIGTTCPRPVYHAWREYRRAPSWRAADAVGFGSEVARYSSCEATHFSAFVELIPQGQGTVTAVVAADTILLGIAGEVEVSTQDETHMLTRYDIVRMPAEVPFRYANVGLEVALVFSAREGGPEATEAPRNTSGSGSGVVHMRWADYRREFEWRAPLAKEMGFHRQSGPFVSSRKLLAHMVGAPVGQTLPWHAIPSDVMFLHLQGEGEFRAAGQSWTLEPLDMLLLPAYTPYVYSNVGLSHMLYFPVLKERPPGQKNVYYVTDPGWPVSPDSETLDTDY